MKFTRSLLLFCNFRWVVKIVWKLSFTPAGFQVENLKIRVSGRVPGCAPGEKNMILGDIFPVRVGFRPEFQIRAVLGWKLNFFSGSKISGPGRPAHCRAPEASRQTVVEIDGSKMLYLIDTL